MSYLLKNGWSPFSDGPLPVRKTLSPSRITTESPLGRLFSIGEPGWLKRSGPPRPHSALGGSLGLAKSIKYAVVTPRPPPRPAPPPPPPPRPPPPPASRSAVC